MPEYEINTELDGAEEYIDQNIASESNGRVKEFFKKFFRHKAAFIAAIFILILVIVAIIGPYIAPYDSAAYDYANMMQPPTWAHPFGTDEYGRDVLSRMIVGTRTTLGVALSSVLIGAVIGTVLGILSGYYGGILEVIVMRGSDIMFSFPDILLCIAIVAIIGPGIINVFIAVAVFTVPSFARMMRSATLQVKGLLYVEASKSIGCNNWRTMFRYIFPGTTQTMIINFTMRIGSAIMAAASLSFLGFGGNVTNPDWGSMLSTGRDYFGVASYLIYFPGLVIFLTVLAFNVLGDGLRDTLDPKIK